MNLTRSQRVNLIKQCAKELNKETRDQIEVTLRQFGLNTFDDNGEMEDISYALRVVEDAADKTLLELAAHLGLSPSVNASRRLEPDFWEPAHLRLFISHTNAHKSTATQLKAYLKKYAIYGFIAHVDIEPTRQWEDEILAALDSCHALIALMYEDFHKSKWVDQEIGFAMGRGVPVCSVNLGEKPYGFIARYQAFLKPEDMRELAASLFDAYKNDSRTRIPLADALVARFEESSSFVSARDSVELLQNMPELTKAHAERMRKALKTNRQIYDSFGVPDIVAAIVKKVR